MGSSGRIGAVRRVGDKLGRPGAVGGGGMAAPGGGAGPGIDVEGGAGVDGAPGFVGAGFASGRARDTRASKLAAGAGGNCR